MSDTASSAKRYSNTSAVLVTHAHDSPIPSRWHTGQDIRYTAHDSPISSRWHTAHDTRHMTQSYTWQVAHGTRYTANETVLYSTGGTRHTTQSYTRQVAHGTILSRRRVVNKRLFWQGTRQLFRIFTLFPHYAH